MLRHFLIGILVLLGADLAGFVCLYLASSSDVIGLFLWVAPAVVAAFVSHRVPRLPVVTATGLAIPAALLFAAGNLLLEQFGKPVDYSGPLGFVMVFVMSLPLLALLCAFGAGIGFLSRNGRHA